VAAARAALGWTLEYVKERHAFGQPIGSFQNTRFVLAEIATEVEVAETFVDRCVVALNAGELTAEEAAMAKWWCTELQKRVVDRCLQLFGGYGYMLEYPIARAYADARINHDLRGHHRDHEGDHRQVAGAVVPPTGSKCSPTWAARSPTSSSAGSASGGPRWAGRRRTCGCGRGRWR